MTHALVEQRFGSYEDVKKWLDESVAAEGEDFYWRNCLKHGRNVQQAMEPTLNKALFIILPNLTRFFGKNRYFIRVDFLNIH